MKVKTIKISIGYLLLIFLNCHETLCQTHVAFGFDDFQIKTNLKGTTVNTAPLTYPCEIKFLYNKLVITNCDGDYLYSILDTNTGKNRNSFIRKGRGPGEMIFPDYIQVLDSGNVINTYDPVMRKLNYYDYNKILINEDINFMYSITIHDVVVKIPIFTADNKFTCVLYGDIEGKRFAKLNTDGILLHKMGYYPILKRDYPKDNADVIFQTFAELTPDKQRIITTYKYWDRIEVRNMECKEMVQISGPKIKLPEVYVENENVRPMNVVECYSDIATGPDGFMLLYYGLEEPEEPGLAESYHYVLYFDYNGKPLARYELYPGVKNIAVDWNNNTIYGINLEMEPTIHKYKYK